jgi:hypothetical protein
LKLGITESEVLYHPLFPYTFLLIVCTQYRELMEAKIGVECKCICNEVRRERKAENPSDPSISALTAVSGRDMLSCKSREPSPPSRGVAKVLVAPVMSDVTSLRQLSK